MTHAPAPPSVPRDPSSSQLEDLIENLERLQVLRYVMVACFTVSNTTSCKVIELMDIQACLWDWILAIPDELRMVRTNCGRPKVSYFLAAVYMMLR